MTDLGSAVYQHTQVNGSSFQTTTIRYETTTTGDVTLGILGGGAVLKMFGKEIKEALIKYGLKEALELATQ
jgi:hypothetical protein